MNTSFKEILRTTVEFLAALVLGFLWLMALQGVQATGSVPFILGFIALPFLGIGYYWGALRRAEAKLAKKPANPYILTTP